MALQASWVEHLFAKLTVRYGVAFARLYPDLDIDLIKADWSEVLDGVSGEALSYALRYLPGTPLNAMQFRDLCRRAPVSQHHLQLTAPTGRADPGRVQEIVGSLRASMRVTAALTPAEKCARNIAEIVKRRGYMSIAQRQQMEAMGYLKPERVVEAQQPLQAQQRVAAYRSEVA